MSGQSRDGSEAPEDPDALNLPSWLEGDEGGAGRGADRRRPTLVLVLAALPWAVVLFLVVARPGFLNGEHRDAPAPPEQVGAVSPADAVPSDAPASAPDGGDDPGEVRGQDPLPSAAAGGPQESALGTQESALGTRESVLGARFGASPVPGPGHAGAVAALVVRDRLGALGPRAGFAADGSDGETYVEHVVIEDVDLSIPPLAVVSVLAVVLQRPGQETSQAQVVRLAVPVLLDAAGARPAGEPWFLAAPQPDAVDLNWTAIDDPALAADVQIAVETAGYTDVEIRSLESGDSWPLRTHVRATAPGAQSPDEHVVWLREYLGDLVVAGSHGAPADPSRPGMGTEPKDQHAPGGPEAPEGAGDEETSP